ncbi:hypothetical protein [Nitrobacter sp. JJSN]|uniref:hypothetical protein n=1 Tax=Nitrobacter sp. JJSN TaxID=3453033 RepID=UPI003F76DEA1
MTTRKQSLLDEAKAASQDYANVRKQLADAKALNALGIRSEMLALSAIEHSAYHRWHRALTALANS